MKIAVNWAAAAELARETASAAAACRQHLHAQRIRPGRGHVRAPTQHATTMRPERQRQSTAPLGSDWLQTVVKLVGQPTVHVVVL